MNECYECGVKTDMLSNRSRCAHCEHRRAILNEQENERLREQLGSLKRKYGLALENQVPKWISVDERLPDVLEVRVKLLDGSEVNCWAQSDGDFYWKCGGSEMFISEHQVTHWMPLPQPPKGEGE